MTPTETTDKSGGTLVSTKLVPLARIDCDLGFQVRGAVQPQRVKEFEAVIQEQKFMDPMDCFFEGEITAATRFLMADGFHRFDAYTGCGTTKAPVNLRMGSRSDALRFALRKNGHHGERMTNAEKRHACELAVLDPEVGNLTDADIAKMIGCSATLVGQARRGESKAVTSAKAQDRLHKKTGGSGQPLVPVTAHERKAPGAPPTKAMILKQVEDWVNRDQMDEKEVVALFEAKEAAYAWTAKPGVGIDLRIVGKSGREQLAVRMVVKAIDAQTITLKNEGARLTSAEE